MNLWNGLEIEICGLWMWVGGETKKHKDALKDAGYKWAIRPIPFPPFLKERGSSTEVFSPSLRGRRALKLDVPERSERVGGMRLLDGITLFEFDARRSLFRDFVFDRRFRNTTIRRRRCMYRRKCLLAGRPPDGTVSLRLSGRAVSVG